MSTLVLQLRFVHDIATFLWPCKWQWLNLAFQCRSEETKEKTSTLLWSDGSSCDIQHFVFQEVNGVTSSYRQCALCRVNRLRVNQTELGCPNIWALWAIPIRSMWPSPGPRKDYASLVRYCSSSLISAYRCLRLKAHM